MNLPNPVAPDRPRTPMASGPVVPEAPAEAGLDPFATLLGDLFRLTPQGSDSPASPGDSEPTSSPSSTRRSGSRSRTTEFETGEAWSLAGYAGLPLRLQDRADLNSIATRREDESPASSPGAKPDTSPAPTARGEAPASAGPLSAGEARGQGELVDESTSAAMEPGAGPPIPEGSNVAGGTSADPSWVPETPAGVLTETVTEEALEATAAAADAGPGVGDSGSAPPVGSTATGDETQSAENAPGGEGASSESPPAAGTSVAELEIEMRPAPIMNENAGFEGQDLPGRSPFSLGEEVHAHGERRAGASPSESPVTSPAAFGLNPLDRWMAGAVEASVSVPGERSLDRAERLAKLAGEAVVRMRQAEAGEYEVSIRPDADTEIRLKISLGTGHPEVRAELRRGDAAAFQASWSELQDRLAQQGIRLMPSDPWRAGQDFSGTSSHSGARRNPELPKDEPGVRRRSTTVATPTILPAPTRGVRGRGWETWA